MGHIKAIIKSAKKIYSEEGLINLLQKIPDGTRSIPTAVYKDIRSYYLIHVKDMSLWEYRYTSEDIGEMREYAKSRDSERSELVYEMIKNYGDSPSNILSIGCHAGTRLEFLRQRGLKNLYGVELSDKAVSIMKQEYPELYNNDRINVGRVQEVTEDFSSDYFDVVYSVSALKYIDRESNVVFDEMARISKDLIITIEQDKPNSPSSSRRNYKNIFESRSFSQQFEQDIWVETNAKDRIIHFEKPKKQAKQHTLRVFKKTD